MISYIIPTLWKSDRIYQTIEAIKTSAYGVELIIIDNANSNYESDHDSIKVLKPGENIYVNPAWNLGIEHSSMPYSCLLNDDVTFNIELFNREFHEQVINSSLKNELGMIAFKSGSGFSEEVNHNTDKLDLINLDTMGTGFGQIMLFQTDLYEPIPNEIKIFFGDNLLHYLFESILGRKIMCFEGLKVVGEFSVTSKPFEDQIQKELPYFEQTVKMLYNKYNNKN